MSLLSKTQVISIWCFQDLESHCRKWDKIEDQKA